MIRAVVLAAVLPLAACQRAEPLPPVSRDDLAPVAVDAAVADLPRLTAAELDALAPAERYFQPDYAAQPGGRGGDPLKYLAWVDTAIAERPGDLELRLERAYQRARTGQGEAAIADYRLLLADPELDPFLRRRVHWYFGWSLFQVGRDAEALYQWRQAEEDHRGRPEWVPYTYALALWRMGREAQAVEWFQRAVVTDPRWGSDEGLEERIARWQPVEREAARRVQRAWREAGRG